MELREAFAEAERHFYCVMVGYEERVYAGGLRPPR